MKEFLDHTKTNYLKLEERLLSFLDEHLTPGRVVRLTMITFGFIFIYFGIQKPATLESPPRSAIRAFVFAYSIDFITLGSIMTFIGLYEVFLGVLFITNQYRLSALLFIPHQLSGFVLLVLMPSQYFHRGGVLTIFGFDLYWGLTAWSAFVFKNLIFICAFLFIITYYVSQRTVSNSHTEKS